MEPHHYTAPGYYTYLVCAFTLTYVLHRPVQVFAAFVSIQLLLFACLQPSFSCSLVEEADQGLLTCTYRNPIATAVGCIAAALAAHTLRVPLFVGVAGASARYYACLSFTLATILASAIAWSYVDPSWWFNVAVVPFVQVASVAFSYLLVPYDQVWDAVRGASFRTHLHLALSLLVLTLFNGIALNAAHRWELVFAVSSGCLVALVYAIYNSTTRDTIPRMVSTQLEVVTRRTGATDTYL